MIILDTKSSLFIISKGFVANDLAYFNQMKFLRYLKINLQHITQKLIADFNYPLICFYISKMLHPYG